MGRCSSNSVTKIKGLLSRVFGVDELAKKSKEITLNGATRNGLAPVVRPEFTLRQSMITRKYTAWREGETSIL
jgi:hypothetical protein